MADFLAGDVIARLRGDTAQFTQAITDALARLAQLSQATAAFRQQQAQSIQTSQQQAQSYSGVAQAVQQSTQATTQASQAQAGNRQSANQLAAAYLAMAQSIAQQTQAYSAAQSATLAYKQQQDALRTTLREQREAQQAATAATKEAAAAAQASSGAWRSMLAVAGGIGIATGIGALIGQVKELAVETVQTGVRFESLRASLSALGGGTSAGAAQFQMLVATAQQLGVALEPLARGWRTLTAAASQAGLPLADQQRLLVALAAEARRVGASQEELGRAILAVGQIASKGKVSMEELRQQLGEALPTALAAAAKGMGVTTAELIKLVETGVSFEPFAKALTRGFEEMQTASGKFTDGSREAFNRLGNAWKILQDTIMKGGLGTYLVQVAKNLQEAVEWTTKLTKGAPGAAGPTIQDLGATPAQSQEESRLQRLIALYQQQITPSTSPAMREQREGMIARMQEQLDQVREAARATGEQATAQEKVTAEVNKTTSAQERQASFTKELAVKLAEVKKLQEDAAKRAALAPEVLGSLTGTPEQLATLRKEQQDVLATAVKNLTAYAGTPPAGVTVIAEQRAEIRALSKDHDALGTAMDKAKEAERARLAGIREDASAAQRAVRELAAEAKRAETEALELDSTLERLRGAIRRPSESPSEEARTRVQVQGAQQQRALEEEIVKLDRSPSLQRNRPEALGELQAMREVLAAATQAQAQLAASDVLKRQLGPLAELARAYGSVTKEISDLAKAQDVTLSLIGTDAEEQAFAYLATIENVAKVEAQIVDLRRQADASAPAGIASIKQARDTEHFTEDLQGRLEQLQTPPDERDSARLRRQAQRKGVNIGPQEEALLQQIAAQERWNSLIEISGRIGDAAAQSITSGLIGIIDGTKSVSEAFREMAKSIIDSFAQILISESIRGLIRLGLGAVFGALSAGAGAGFSNAGASAGGGGQGFEILMGAGASKPFASGGYVSKPTRALIGESGPEWVLGQSQMQQVMQSAIQAAPSAGGQAVGGQAAGGQGITIINVASREQAKTEQAREQAMGRQVVLNYVMDELSQGSGSRIGRLIRSGGH